MGKIIFLGTTDFAVSVLATLRKSEHEILRVFTQPPNKSKRGQKIIKTPIHQYSEKYNLPVNVPNKLASEINLIKSMNLDLAVVVAYGQIIPKNFLNLTKKGFINIHASLLPKWRGAAPIQRSIMNLDHETGISVMKINEELDRGPVSNIYRISLDQNLNAQEVSEKLSLLAADKILDNIDDILDGKSKFNDQDHVKATYAKKIFKSEGQINWKDDALRIIGKINGLYPSPGAFFNFNGERYKILKAEIGNSTGKSGEVITDGLEIACGYNKSIKILEIQREGKKVQKIREFMLGSQIRKGSVLSNV